MDGEFLENRRNQYMVVALTLMFAAIGVGTISGDFITFAWAGLGFGALVFMVLAFPRCWKNFIWLAAIYTLSILGVLSLMVWEPRILQSTHIFFFLGLFLLAVALYLNLALIARIKLRRDSMGIENYVPLGIWSMGVLSFFGLSLLSGVFWIYWAQGGSLAPYVATEALLSMAIIGVLWIPERSLDWDVEQAPVKAEGGVLSKAKMGMGVARKGRNVCPACGLDVQVEQKSCPACGENQNFGWCPVSEIFVLPCSQCKTLNTYGNKACSTCKEPLEMEITCPECGKEHALEKWRKPKKEKKEDETKSS